MEFVTEMKKKPTAFAQVASGALDGQPVIVQ